MHPSECIVALAEGGFKTNNGPPRVGKGPMTSKEDKKSSNEASLPKPTQAGRIELCQEAIKEAMRCLGNGDKDCVTRLIEELVKANCYNGNAVGKKVAGKVKDVVHELWLASSGDNEFKCELLTILRDLGISRTWVGDALGMGKNLNRWIAKCGIRWEGKVTRNNVVKAIESLLRRLGWDEIRMCETLLKYIGVDAEVLRRYGIEPCDWVHVEFDEVYFMGIALSDLHVDFVEFDKYKYIKASLDTTNTISAVLFLLLLQPIQRPSISIKWHDGETGLIQVGYFITVRADKWGWVNREELIKRIRALRPEDVPRLIAGAVDGDGSIRYEFNASRPLIEISACKACEKRVFLDALQEALGKLGIKSHMYEDEVSNGARLKVYGEDATKLLRLIMPYLRHPLKRLRAKLILMLYDGKIDYDTFDELYNQTKYGDSNNDPKRFHGLEALAQAAPQTHTHGE
ncbi:LAGLIDADG family homing endonuclease [Vulcanisaeta sp. EB80]|uniref:LAGLIDADG family homing endonuclease n=1 Tax=Vulcanisaeta sp. EB80 TaxID=1650660 RepID=UPI0011812C56|nr:LAGLIDADG family homing endonuclease [Vulcanisaeta sp. EB80]